MKISTLTGTVVIAAALVLSGCSGLGMKDDDAADAGGAAVTEGGGGGATTSAASRGGAWSGSPLDNPDSLLYTKTVYFDFDQSTIRSEFHDVLRAHADFLNSNRSASVTIEGHCDERGSREYNIGLGERRSNAVRAFLEAEGVDRAQIGTISYGEEQPADLGHDERAWALNRRGVLVY